MLMTACLRCGVTLPSSGNPGAPRKWCSENCRKRAADDRSRKPCADCGRPMGEGSGWPCKSINRTRCHSCDTVYRRAGREAKLDDVQLMWEEGLSQAEIAHQLGYGPNSSPPEISELFKAGRIEYRRAGMGRRYAA